MCRKLLKIYRNCNAPRLSEIFTGYETWIHYFKSQSKIDNKMWLPWKAKRPVIAKRYQGTKKVLNTIVQKANQSPDMYTNIMCWKILYKCIESLD